MSEILLMLPKDLEIERLVLAGMLIDPKTMNDARRLVDPQDFSINKHRQICQVAYDLYDTGRTVNTAIVAAELRTRRHLDPDGIAYLADLDNGMPVLIPETFSGYVEVLIDRAMRRRLIEAAAALQQRAACLDEPVEKLAREFASMGSIAEGSYDGALSTQQVIDKLGINQLLAPRRQRGITAALAKAGYSTIRAAATRTLGNRCEHWRRQDIACAANCRPRCCSGRPSSFLFPGRCRRKSLYAG